MANHVINSRIHNTIARMGSSELVTGFGLAIIIGVISGLGAVAFRWLISNFTTLFFDGGGHLLSFLSQYYVILIPALGGLLVGPMIYFLAREAKGHGVPEVMEAVAIKRGHIRPRVAVVKSLASSLCIGSGGSVGREGPIVQIGASAGSAIGQWLKLPDDIIKTLVACGAAGGISATFNAPIAGVFFAMEIIIGRIVTRRFAYVVISSVIADFVAHIFLGTQRAFVVPQFSISSPWEIGFYAVLGILAAFAATFFIKILYWSEDLFEKMKFPEYLKPVLGGLVIGIIGLYSADLFGVGYGGIQNALSGQFTITALLALFFLKILATSFTLGSGGSGGIFAPSLFIGAVMGTAFGILLNSAFPTISSSPAAYGVVAMAAVFAGAARAPFSAILIIFEMTGAYTIILPVMTAVVISTVLSRQLSRESIYTLKLVRRGVDIAQEEVSGVMRTIRVKDAMTSNFPAVRPEMPVKELMQLFQKTGYHGFPVVDKKQSLVSMVTLTDVGYHLVDGENNLTVADIATNSPFVAYPDQSLDRVLGATDEDYGRIPVVSQSGERRLLGVLQRQDIIKAYRQRLRQLKKTSSS